MLEGMVTILLSLTSRKVRLLSWQRGAGSSVRLLLARWRLRSLWSAPISAGSELRLLLLRVSLSKHLKVPISAGISFKLLEST